jgi:hypothetical protein
MEPAYEKVVWQIPQIFDGSRLKLLAAAAINLRHVAFEAEWLAREKCDHSGLRIFFCHRIGV